MADNEARRKAAQNIAKDLDPTECVWQELPGDYMTYGGQGEEKWHGEPQRWLEAGIDPAIRSLASRGDPRQMAATREQRLILIDQLDAVYLALESFPAESSAEKQALYEQAEDLETEIKLMRGTAKPSVRRGRAGRGGGGRASAPVVKKKAFVPPLAGGSAANARELYRKRYGVDPPTHRE